jgi:hypothetical protein
MQLRGFNQAEGARRREVGVSWNNRGTRRVVGSPSRGP